MSLPEYGKHSKNTKLCNTLYGLFCISGFHHGHGGLTHSHLASRQTEIVHYVGAVPRDGVRSHSRSRRRQEADAGDTGIRVCAPPALQCPTSSSSCLPQVSESIAASNGCLAGNGGVGVYCYDESGAGGANGTGPMGNGIGGPEDKQPMLMVRKNGANSLDNGGGGGGGGGGGHGITALINRQLQGEFVCGIYACAYSVCMYVTVLFMCHAFHLVCVYVCVCVCVMCIR